MRKARTGGPNSNRMDNMHTFFVERVLVDIYKSENPLGCELWDPNEEEAPYPKDEKEFSQYPGRLVAMCFCNESAICATQPETFESILSAQRSNLPFYAIKAAEIVLKYMRAGEMPNNASEVYEEFMATLSTPTSITEDTTTEASTVETTTTTKTSSTDMSTTSTETSTTATSTTSSETSTTVTSTTSTETSTTFATTSDYEYSDTSTTSAYGDSSTVTDTGSEVTELQQMDSFLEQYGLVIAVACGILLILVIILIAYMMRKGKANVNLEVAIGKGGASKSKESKGTSKEGSKESQTSKTKESGSKEKKTGSKD
nr:unnamed protein product [Haemonchus contortus]